MRRVLLPLFLLSALVVPVFAAAPSGATSSGDGRSGTAAAPAAVRSVLKQTPGGNLKGRLTSSRSDCVKDRDVYLIIRPDGDDYPDIEYVATTNGQGRWSFSLSRRRQTSYRFSVFTLGGPRCEVAQSNQITYDLDRPGSGVAPAGGGLADVAITLEGGQVASLHGKISSSRDVCHEFRPVFAFFRPAGTHDPFMSQLISISRKNGKYFFNEDGTDPRLRGVPATQIITVVPGTNNCRPAQSKLKEFSS